MELAWLAIFWRLNSSEAPIYNSRRLALPPFLKGRFPVYSFAMKWRIVLTAVFVLTLFAGFAYLYVNIFVRKHQNAIILFVVPGLDLNTLNLARQQMGPRPLRSSEPDDPLIDDARRHAAERNQRLNLDSFWNIALLSIQEPGQPVPDEGADATALACGQRVENGFVAVNSSNTPLQSLIYAAESARRATGLVTTSSLVQPTPGSLIAMSTICSIRASISSWAVANNILSPRMPPMSGDVVMDVIFSMRRRAQVMRYSAPATSSIMSPPGPL